MRKFGEFALKYRIALLGVVLALTVILFRCLPNLEIESDMKTWFSENDPTYIIYDRFVEDFPEATSILVAYESENIFSKTEIA